MPEKNRKIIVDSSGEARVEEQKPQRPIVKIQGRRVMTKTEAQEEALKEKEEREALARFWRKRIEKEGEHSETISFGSAGQIKSEKPDGDPFYILNQFPSVKTTEDLYDLLRKVGDEHPNLEITVKENRRESQFTYTVTDKESFEKRTNKTS